MMRSPRPRERLGFLLSPPVVGAVADASSLRTGLIVVPAAGLLVVVVAGVLSQKPRLAPPAKRRG